MENLKAFIKNEDGVGVVEMVLILVVLIGLVVIFKNQLTGIIRSVFQRISSQTSSL